MATTSDGSSAANVRIDVYVLSPQARDEMCKVLCKMASLSDGVRCDMAMLICEDILEKTWGGRLAPHGQPRANGQFWPPTIKVRPYSSISEGRLKTLQ